MQKKIQTENTIIYRISAFLQTKGSSCKKLPCFADYYVIFYFITPIPQIVKSAPELSALIETSSFPDVF